LTEPLNRGRKGELLRNYVDWHVRYKYRDRRWIISFENGLKSYVYPYPDHDAGEVNIWTSNVDFHDIRLARAVLKPGDFVVDAGCNVGNRTLALADMLSGALLIDAGSTAVRRCREHLRLNGLDEHRFTVLEAAVGDAQGEVYFTDLGGANTCNKVVSASDGTPQQLVRVPLTTIDAEVARLGRLPAFIKIDVEGQDYRALLGARKTLESGAVRLVKFERHQTEPLEPFLDFFHGLGWTVFGLDGQGRMTTDDAVTRKLLNLFSAPPEISASLKRLELA
jgi:FkbM family methyltransferase